MRALLIAEACNPQMVSVPLEGWSHARAIASLVDTHLVTRVTWSEFRAEDVRDEWFQREYLPRFSE